MPESDVVARFLSARPSFGTGLLNSIFILLPINPFLVKREPQYAVIFHHVVEYIVTAQTEYKGEAAHYGM